MPDQQLYCLCCPLCGQPPDLVLDVTQAFCGNMKCTALTWNMTRTLDENLLNANAVRLPNWLTKPTE